MALDLLTLASNCSISTDMVSNILSWVELLSNGVVSDLKEEKQRTKLTKLKEISSDGVQLHIHALITLTVCGRVAL